MLRWLLLRAAGSPALETRLRDLPITQRVVRRYVAGDTLGHGLWAAEALVQDGRDIDLDHVGEAVTDHAEARHAATVYHEVLDRLTDVAWAGPGGGRSAGISVKPSQLGLDLDAELAATLVGDLVTHADRSGVHVTLDMEEHESVEGTVRLVERTHAAGHTNLGCALQAQLHRTADDVRRLSRLGASVRLCKGAYAPRGHVAYRSPHLVTRAFAEHARVLLREGHDPRFATHDHRLVAAIKRDAARLGVERDRFEFQMLYGVRPELQQALITEGYRLRVYVPFGPAWFPYFTRRLAERPANLIFFLRALTDRRPTSTPRPPDPARQQR